jgi:putative tryptophan/tyrosine transport system substrate-binding protein
VLQKQVQDRATAIRAVRPDYATLLYVRKVYLSLVEWANVSTAGMGLRQLAADLARRHPAVIVAGGSGGGLAGFMARAAASATPIVFTSADDPVKLGLVDSLNRPSSNATGVSFFTGILGAKRMEILRELVPTATVIGFLANLSNTRAEVHTKDVEAAARALGRQLIVVSAGPHLDLGTAFEKIVGQGARALVVQPDASFNPRRKELVELAAPYVAHHLRRSRSRDCRWPSEPRHQHY